MPDLIVESVGLHRLAEIYPLIRSATRVSLERWKGFGEALLAGGGGVLAVIAPDDCIHGVATYRSIRNLRHEQSLQIEILVAFELIPHATVRRALCGAIERLARDRGCDTIVFTVDAQRHADSLSAARLSWEVVGLELETVGFVQQL